MYCRFLVDPICEALKNMGLKGAMVVHGGLDEVSVSGPTRYARLSGGTISRGDLRPEDAGLSPLPADDLRVTSPGNPPGRSWTSSRRAWEVPA